ncbi:hypothetical protein [Methylobacterium sp.]|uniref:hypothetical protein n=1 Tax=Methylobacterium sp. TaxID=409 RepID=UPI003B01D005
MTADLSSVAAAFRDVAAAFRDVAAAFRNVAAALRREARWRATLASPKKQATRLILMSPRPKTRPVHSKTSGPYELPPGTHGIVEP